MSERNEKHLIQATTKGTLETIAADQYIRLLRIRKIKTRDATDWEWNTANRWFGDASADSIELRSGQASRFLEWSHYFALNWRNYHKTLLIIALRLERKNFTKPEFPGSSPISYHSFAILGHKSVFFAPKLPTKRQNCFETLQLFHIHRTSETRSFHT